jgi:hypothetical protein
VEAGGVCVYGNDHADSRRRHHHAQSSGSYFVCAESGGGRYLVADRPAAGPWETFWVHTYDDGRVSLQAHSGEYVCAEPDGSVIANRAVSGEWERFEIEVRDNSIVAFKTAHGTYLQAPQGGGANLHLVHAISPTMPGEWEFFRAGTRFWETGPPQVSRPLVGPLRIENKLFRDDEGFRRVFFCSWFNAIRCLKDNPAEFVRQLDAIVAAGYQGVRVFLSVGGWTPAGTTTRSSRFGSASEYSPATSFAPITTASSSMPGPNTTGSSASCCAPAPPAACVSTSAPATTRSWFPTPTPRSICIAASRASVARRAGLV